MKQCSRCKKKIDLSHDRYYYCNSQKHFKIICSSCYIKVTKCPICKKKLQRHGESITKKCFFNPATRNGLGF